MSSLASPAPRAYRNYTNGEMIADGAVHADCAGRRPHRLFGAVPKGRAARRAKRWRRDGDLRRGFLSAVRVLLRLQHGAAVAGEMAAQALRPRLDLSDDRRHLYGAPVAGLFRFLDDRAFRHRVTGALAGASLKLFLPGRFDRVSIGVYLALGWSALIAIKPLISALPAETLAFVVAGGALYSVGVAFHLWRASSTRTSSGTSASPRPPPAILPECFRRSGAEPRSIENLAARCAVPSWTAG